MIRRARAGALLAGAVAALLASCGGGAGNDEATAPTGSVALIGTPYAPSPALRRLITNAARDADAELVQRDPPADARGQLAQLRPLLPASSGLESVVIGAVDPAATERLLASRKPGGPSVISLLTPVRGARATITLDPDVVSGRLARRATSWARRHGGIGDATVIAPPDSAAGQIVDWSVPAGRQLAAQLVDDLSDAGFAVTTLEALGTADAKAQLGTDPSPVVIGWNDATAMAAADASGRHWLGAAGSPAPTSAAALERLDLIVGTRLTELAGAVIRASGAGDEEPARGSVPLPVHTFSRGSQAAQDAAADAAD